MTFLAAVSIVAFFALAMYRQAARDRTIKKGEIPAVRCTACGYDLRGTHYRCPECGTEFVPPLDRRMLGTEWPADAIKPRVPSFEETPEMVHLTSDPFESNLLVEQLNLRGIAARREFVAGGTDRLGNRLPVGIRVMVWSGDTEPARAYVTCLRERRRERLFERMAVTVT